MSSFLEHPSTLYALSYNMQRIKENINIYMPSYFSSLVILLTSVENLSSFTLFEICFWEVKLVADGQKKNLKNLS